MDNNSIIFSPDANEIRKYKAVQAIIKQFPNLAGRRDALLESMYDTKILLESEFSVSSNKIDFFTSDKVNTLKGEIKLNFEDGFVVTSIMPGVRRVVDLIAWKGDPGFPYASPRYFDGRNGASGTLEYQALNAFFQGKLSLSANTEVLFQNYPMQTLINYPISDYVPANGSIPQSFPSFQSADNAVAIYPQRCLVGNTSYRFTVQFADDTAFDAIKGYLKADGTTTRTPASRNVAVLEVRGFVIPGMATTALMIDGRN